MNRIENLKKDLNAKKAVKVIAGIDNFDIEKVKKVVAAADQAGASAVDVAANKEIIFVAKQMTEIPVFVSSIKAQELKMAYEHGADVLEVGNFDALYAQGRRFSAQEVLEITKETIELVGQENIGSSVLLCVTVPGHIEIQEQIKLAQELELLGVNLIQTEGAAVANVESTGARGLMEKAQVSIANTIELARNVDIPVMTASGITSTTSNMAFAAGASAIGIGSCVNKLGSTIEMIAVIRSIVQKVNELKGIQEDCLV